MKAIFNALYLEKQYLRPLLLKNESWKNDTTLHDYVQRSYALIIRRSPSYETAYKYFQLLQQFTDPGDRAWTCLLWQYVRKRCLIAMLHTR